MRNFFNVSLTSRLKRNLRFLYGKRSTATTQLLSKPDNPYELYLLQESPSTDASLSREEALVFYAQMKLIRKTELELAQLYQKKQVVGFCHLYIGQEACAVGVRSVMRPQDTLITSYRCHPWPLLMEDQVEQSMRSLFAELLAKNTGKTI